VDLLRPLLRVRTLHLAEVRHRATVQHLVIVVAGAAVRMEGEAAITTADLHMADAN
jgi:hypothetical protein